MSTQYLAIPIRGVKFSLSIEIKEHLSHRETEYQTIDIYDTEAFGRILTLDGHIQLTELDERVYHEFLVHVPLLSLVEPKTALVIGGGDGGVLRELCKHPSITRIDMAEIDRGVIEESKKLLPFVSGNAFEDPRVHLHIGDAFQFVKSTEHRYDLIVADSTDVYENEAGALSEQLFTESFYRDCKNVLTEQGIIVTQADNLVFCPYSLEHIVSVFGTIFSQVGSYHAVIPSFGGYSGYCWASERSTISPTFASEKAIALGLKCLNQASYDFGLMNFSLGQPV